MLDQRQVLLVWSARGLTGAICLFLLVPLIVLVPVSLTDSNFLTFPTNNLSLQWYQAVFEDIRWSRAAINSAVVAVSAMTIAIALGTFAACGLAMLGQRAATAIYGLLLAPLVIPTVVVALSLYISYSTFGLTASRAGLIVAHAILGLPFVMVSVLASLRKYDKQYYFAALSLGANHPRAFIHAVLPSIWPSILVGGIYALNVSFDEAIVSLFLARPDQATLPKLMFAGMKDNITPAVAAVAVMITAFSLGVMMIYLFIDRLYISSRDSRRINPNESS